MIKLQTNLFTLLEHIKIRDFVKLTGSAVIGLLDLDWKCNQIILPPHLITNGSFTGTEIPMGNSKNNFTPAFYFCLVILSWIICFDVQSYTYLSLDTAPQNGVMFNVQLLKLNRSHWGGEPGVEGWAGKPAAILSLITPQPTA